jgi:hypothetical protein
MEVLIAAYFDVKRGKSSSILESSDWKSGPPYPFEGTRDALVSLILQGHSATEAAEKLLENTESSKASIEEATGKSNFLFQRRYILIIMFSKADPVPISTISATDSPNTTQMSAAQDPTPSHAPTTSSTPQTKVESYDDWVTRMRESHAALGPVIPLSKRPKIVRRFPGRLVATAHKRPRPGKITKEWLERTVARTHTFTSLAVIGMSLDFLFILSF